MEKCCYKLIRMKRKTLAVHVLPDGTVEVRAPLRMPAAVIEKFIASKSGWIKEHVARAEERNKRLAAYHAQEGKTFWFRGQDYRITYARDENAALLFADQVFAVSPHEPIRKKQFQEFLLRQANDYLPARLSVLSRQTGLSAARISVGSARTRWGSCTGRNEIRLSKFLMLLPDACVDYVIIHELCHTKEHNHSAAFWKLVQTYCPDCFFQRERMAQLEREIAPQIAWLSSKNVE